MNASILVVSGTGTDVGKTIVTAAMAALAAAAGLRVAVVKPCQTGVRDGEDGDLATVARLATVESLHEFTRYPEPLSPHIAAQLEGRPGLDLGSAVTRIRSIAADHDLVLVEGAGGLLVEYNDRGETIADLAGKLDAAVVVVVHPNLGTLNHASLTLEALRSRTLSLAGVVIGSWPSEPDLACRTNLADLSRLAGGPLAGTLEHGAGSLSPEAFLAAATRGLAPVFGGQFDASNFSQRFGYRRNP
ncbi:MAG: dethiobiotin synthase [Actinomycetes bacterium]